MRCDETAILMDLEVGLPKFDDGAITASASKP
jgi:hypothetical protein